MILVYVSLLNALVVLSQSINGNVQFQSERLDYSFISVGVEQNKTICDSLGRFELKNISNTDTIEVTPIPIHIKVKLYNLPHKFDTLIFNDIPLFDNIIVGTSIINFGNKRAAKKYFKAQNKEIKAKLEALKTRINNSTYTWNGKEYQLDLIESEGSKTILIDLNTGLLKHTRCKLKKKPYLSQPQSMGLI